jgi:hypothetical protein
MTACGTFIAPQQAEELTRIAHGVNQKPGLSEAAVFLHSGRAPGGGTEKLLLVTARPTEELFADPTRLTQLDREIKTDAKRIYSDIGSLDGIVVRFSIRQGFGPFSVGRNFALPPTRPDDIVE